MVSKTKKTCVVTGGASGIGFATSRLLLKRGYRVAILDINIENMAGLLEKEKNNNLLILKADITSSQEVNSSFSVIIDKFKGIDILVNCAGLYSIENILDESEIDWDRVIDVNLKGTFLCCKKTIPLMIQNQFGIIVNVSSISGKKQSLFASSAYCASKAGIIGFTRCLAYQVAKYNIRVNCVAPGITETNIIKILTDEQVKYVISTIPLGRMAKPIDVANAIYFLISDASNFITGETINVNGGSFME